MFQVGEIHVYNIDLADSHVQDVGIMNGKCERRMFLRYKKEIEDAKFVMIKKKLKLQVEGKQFLVI